MKLTLQPGKNGKMHLHVDGEYRMTADREFCVLAGLKNNMELDETELADLTGKVNSRRAFNKAADLLSRRDHSAHELLQKLRQKGYGDGAEEAIERLRELGFLDDRRFAANYAAELLRMKKFGRRRIESELFQKGIDREIIRETLDELEFPEETLTELIERKYLRYLTDEKGVRRTVNALVRLGYGYGEIRDALEAVQANQQEDAQ